VTVILRKSAAVTTVTDFFNDLLIQCVKPSQLFCKALPFLCLLTFQKDNYIQKGQRYINPVMCRWGCRENNMVCMNVLRVSLKQNVQSQHRDNMAREQAKHY